MLYVWHESLACQSFCLAEVQTTARLQVLLLLCSQLIDVSRTHVQDTAHLPCVRLTLSKRCMAALYIPTKEAAALLGGSPTPSELTIVAMDLGRLRYKVRLLQGTTPGFTRTDMSVS